MKRLTALWLALIITLSLVGCGTGSVASPAENAVGADWGISLSTHNATPKGVTLVIAQTGGDPSTELSYGSEYGLEVLKSGVWETVPYIVDDEVAWTTEATIVNREDSTEQYINFENLYGNLSAGKYRITKSIRSSNRKGGHESHVLYAEFEISQKPSEESNTIPLSAEEISQWNEAFLNVLTTENGFEVTEVSCFFTSFYEKPEAINYVEFLRYCPIGERLEDINSEEYAVFMSALEQVDPSVKDSPSLPVPVRRYPKEAVSAILQKYANITIDDLLNTEGVIYLEEYDAFYNLTSDFAPGSFQCTGGEKIGNTIHLWTDADINNIRTQLTLVVMEGTYYIQSFQQVS